MALFLSLSPVPTTSFSAVSVDRIRSTIAWLSDPALDGRQSQSPGALATADYLLEQFTEIGLSAQLQDIGPGRRNVVARWGNKAAHVIIGAHYDGQGMGYRSASDNAAGVAVMLELARDLGEVDLPVSLVFIAFDDEERGLNGSRYYTEEPVYPLEDARAVIIMDTMGRSFVDLEHWTLVVFGTEFSPELASIVERRRTPEMLPLGTDLLGPRSDFAPFAANQVPYLFFTNATHKDYHGGGDIPSRLQYDRLQTDAETIRQVVVDIASAGDEPTYLEVPSYPEGEYDELTAFLDAIESEHQDLSPSYSLMFADLRERLSVDPTRESLSLAISIMLSAATPRVSSFALSYLIGPLYESEGKREIAVAVYTEALKWTPNPFARKSLEEKIQSLQRD